MIPIISAPKVCINSPHSSSLKNLIFDKDDSNVFSQQYEKTLSVSEKLQITLPPKTL